MRKKIFVGVLILLTLFVLTGCGDNYKSKSIPTEYSKTVSGNGGMTVIYGDYLYFINGLAGETAKNDFGKVCKGAVARVKLSEGKPDGDPEIIVPKNIFGKDKKYGGIRISEDYIYYPTTSTELDGEGNPKTGKGVIMRTKVDGTDTAEIATFDDHETIFTVWGNRLAYVREKNLYSIDLLSKKFDVRKAAEKLEGDCLFEEGYVFFVNKADDKAEPVVNVYSLKSGEVKPLISGKIPNGGDGVKYAYSLLNAIDEEEKITLFYTLTDNTPGAPKTGVYAYSFVKGDFSFDENKAICFTRNPKSFNYTEFYKAGGLYWGHASTKLDAFGLDGERRKNGENVESLNLKKAFTVFDTEETDEGVFLWYTESDNLHRIQIMGKTDEGGYEFGEWSESKLFDGKYDSSFVSPEKVGNVLYYFNSDVSNNIYYYEFSDDFTPKEKISEGRILGIIPRADIIAAF